MRRQIYSFWLYGFMALLVMLGCSRDPVAAPPPPRTIVPRTDSVTPPMKYIALGDSYTIGSSVDSADRFPALAALWMRSNGKALSRVDYIATSGWPTGALLNAISASTLSRNYDLATLLIGVNNQYQRRDTGEYALEFVQCLRRAIDFAGGRKDRVFVLSIPDYSVTPFAINSDRPRIAREIDQFNAINKRLTDSAGISYTDITDISREAAVFPLLIANDGLHPSGAMYKRWADRLAPKMLAVLK